MELGLKGKAALVTGASRGIGQGIAMALADEGCDLLLTGRDASALEEVAGAVRARGCRAETATADLTAADVPGRLAAAARKAFGRLDILVNNAGATKRGDFLTLTDADWADGFGLKFFAHVRLARKVWPMLQASQGSILTIAGIGGKEAEAEFCIGSSVNGACMSFSKALAHRGKSEGVQVNTINPGRVETERLWRRFRGEMERTGRSEADVREDFRKEFAIARFGTVEDIGGLVAFIVSPRGRWLHGATIDMDGGEVRSL